MKSKSFENRKLLPFLLLLKKIKKSLQFLAISEIYAKFAP